MLKRVVTLGAVIALGLVSFGLYAGNHEVIHPTKGHSIGWGNPEAIPYWFDLGGLGRLADAEARVLVEVMMNKWAEVSTARVGFSYQGELPEDVTEDNFLDYLSMTTCGDSERTDIPKNVVPVIFDSDGRIIEYLIGMGSATEVGGVSTLRCFSGTADNPTAIYQGMVILNGQFVDGKDMTEFSPEDLPVNVLAGVMLHELGHLIGLDHTTLNEEIYDDISNNSISADNSRYLPIMLPTVLRSSTSSTMLHPDDIAAISTLYPTEDYLAEVGEIKGEVKSKNGAGVRKVNVIARRGDDPLCEAISTVTGRRCVPLLDMDGEPDFNSTYCDSPEMYGDFQLEGLTPGSYTVEVEELAEGWIRSGMYPSTVDNELPGDAEFYNDRDAASESSLVYSIIDVGADEVVSGIDIVLNNTVDSGTQLDRIPLNEFDNGPATRCRNDEIDYEAALPDIASGGGTDALLDSATDGVPEGGAGAGSGGCTLRQTGGDNTWVPLVIGILFVSAARLLRRRYVMPRARREALVMSLSMGILFLFVVPAISYASTIVPSDLREMSHKAGRIFHGRCIDVKVIKDERGLAATMVTYEVIRGVKGVKEETVTFKVFGVATPDNSGREPLGLVGVTQFYPGREDVLFLYKESPWGFTAPIGLWQGSLPVIRTEVGPRLSIRGGSYGNTSLKAASGIKGGTLTPDDILNKVEKILGK